MCSMNPLQFSFQRIQQLLTHVSKAPHSTVLPGQPYKFPIPAIQSVQADISHLISCHGYELECYYLKCLFAHALEMSLDEKNVHRLVTEDSLGCLLKLQLTVLYRRPNCVSLLSHSLQAAYSQLFSLPTARAERNALSSLNKALKQSLLHTCVLSLSLLPSPLPELRAQAEDLIHSSLPLLISHFVSGDINRHEWQQDATTELMHLLLSYMLQTPEMESCVTSQEVSNFINFLHNEFHSNQILPLVLSPLVYPHSSDISLATLIEPAAPLLRVSATSDLSELVLELGYSCTESKEEVLLLLQQFSPADLSPSCVARIIGAMASHHRDLPDQVSLFPGLGLGDRAGREPTQEEATPHSWVLESFQSALKELVPSLNWREVVLALDNPNFFLPDPDSLSFVMRIYKLATQDPFPVEALYRPWENRRGHLSWLRQALSGCTEFSFADYQMRRINVEQTKYPPEDETKNILTWTSLDLIETLLSLAEGGLYEQVLSLFSYPLKHCSEILLIGLVQAKSQWNVIQLEILSNIVPTIISTHPASHAILSTAWHDPSVRAQTLMMSAISDWYARSPEPYDQSRLTRILEIAQDMKTLVNLLNTGHPFSFAVELACLACRRDYLKLDIWLVEKVKVFRDFFVCSCVNFLKQRVPTPQIADKIPHLNQDIVHTILSSLTGYTNTLNQDTAESLQQLLQLFGPIPARFRPQSIPLGKTESPFSPAPLDLTGLGFQPTPGGIPQSQVYPGTPLSLPPTPSSPLKAPGMQGMYKNVIHGVGQSHQNPLMFPGSGATDPSSPYGMMSRSGLPGAQNSLQSINTSRFSARQPPPEQSVIEKKANQYFQKLYVKSLTVEMFLSKLKGFKDSPIPEDRSLFQCILKNMFDEYHYFSQFPEKELEITGQLFGGLINEALLCVSDLEQALKCVLDALKKPLESKMFHFGIAALYKFIARIKENPQYCHHIAAIPHFQAFPTIIVEFVQYGKNQEHPPHSFSFLQQDVMGREMQTGQRHTQGILPPGTGGQLTDMQNILQGPPSVTELTTTQTASTPLTAPTHPPTPGVGLKKEPSLSNPPKIDTLLSAADQGEERPQGPSADIQDKVHFIFNNLSASNLTLKTDDFRKLVQTEHYPWAARYLVMQRASTEMNLHNLYMSFLDAFQDPVFNLSVLKETYRNIKVILRSDKNLNNIADRTLLKSLGHWLGLQTLAKNRPILHVDLAVKELVLEAYHKGMQDLLYVVPFVSKVLESCAESRVFKPPNPWVTGIMRVLSELHAIPDLKLNLKFEIEVLCKNLSLEIAEVEPSQLLEDKQRAMKLCQLGKQEQEEGARQHPVIDTELKQIPYDPSVQQPDPKTPFFEAPAQPTGPQHPALYQYHAISTILPNMSSLVNINPRIALFQAYPQLQNYVWSAIEQAIKDLIRPVADRAMKIALTTAEHIVKKDFALDHDENRMRAAAHHMVKHMAAGMALITCRDPLLITISKHLLAAFKGRLGAESNAHMEQAASQVANDNTELACAFIQKTVVEQVSQEIDKKLSEEYELRSAARQQGRRYCNTEVLTYHAQRMPEQISLKPGPALQQQIAVYEEFGRCLPGFHPMAPPQRKDTLMHSRHSEAILNSPDLVFLLSQCTQEVEGLLHIAIQSPYSPLVTCLKHLLDTLNKAQLARNQQVIFALIREALEGLFKALNFQMDSDILIRFRDVYLYVLRCLQECKALGVNFVALHVTLALLEQRPDHRYYLPIIDLLTRLHMIDMREIDAFVAKEIERGDSLAMQFGANLAKHFLLTNKREPMFSESDLSKTLQALTRLTYSSPSPPELLLSILEAVKHHGAQQGTLSNTSTGLGHVQGTEPGLPSQAELYGQSGGIGGLPGHILSDLDPGLLAAHLPQTPGPDLSAPHPNPLSRMQPPHTPSQHGGLEDPPGLAEKVELLLSEWVRSYHHPMLVKDMDQVYFMFMNKLQQQGIMTNGDLITRFFRISVEMCVGLCYKSMNEPDNQRLARAKCYHTMDAFVKLVAVLVRFTGDPSNIPPKVNVLQNVISTVTQVLLQDHQNRGVEFHQLPYQRFFIMLLTELNARDPAFEPMSQHVLTIYSQVYHELRPAKAPGFAYAWLELVSHRIFIEKVLIQTPQPKGWQYLQQLLVDLFSFLAPFLRNADLERPLQILYKGTLRVLLVLLHDFPEFLCDHHFVFCNVIPPNCIQMRNLILSAFPRNLRLPDPFTPDLKFEELPEIAQSPRILGDYLVIIPPEFKSQLDAFLQAESVDKSFPAKLREVLQSTATLPDSYNIPLLNALILSIGQSGILALQESGAAISSQSVQESPHFSLLRGLVAQVDTKGRYLLLNAVTNQLRYPNSDTHYFSLVLLALFLKAQSEMVQEQITRVLLERLIVYRPHPWGLLVTFIELIKGEEYNFWEHRFVHCAPEIERLFESVAQSCTQQKQAHQQTGTREEELVA